MHIEVKRQSWELALSLCPLGPRDQIQIVNLGSMPLCLLSHLSSPTQHPAYTLFYISFTEYARFYEELPNSPQTQHYQVLTICVLPNKRISQKHVLVLVFAGNCHVNGEEKQSCFQ